jgi:hypothetical protein
MSTNFYFQNGNTSGTTNEQRLLEDLIIESIKIYGHDVYYLPRRSMKQDEILGEDVMSRFENAYPIEMYLANVQGWEGNGDLFTKFGIQLTDQATFAVSKRRWEESIGFENEIHLQLPGRPAEGDIIYLPKTNSFFEIKYVQHLDPFYQLGKFYLYSMQCELFVYSSEDFDTGVEEIDAIENIKSQNLFEYQILTQTGDFLLTQNGGSLIAAEYSTETFAPSSDSEDFEAETSGILDFSIRNPFGEF